MVGRPLSNKYSIQVGFSVETHLGENLDYVRNATLTQDFDCGGIIDGNEGAGKSLLAQQVGKLLDAEHDIGIDQIVFTPEDFKKAALTLKKGKCIIFDEARGGFNRRRSMNDVNIQLVDLMAEIRQRNLFFIFVLPSFYDLDMNIAVWRTRFLLHVWYDWDAANPSKPLRRGFYRFYNEQGKKKLYTNKFFRVCYEYPFLKNQCFDARFPKYWVVDEEAYRQKKAEAVRAYGANSDPFRCPVCKMKAKKKDKKSGNLVCPIGHEWPETVVQDVCTTAEVQNNRTHGNVKEIHLRAKGE